jgi:hypothetical protein
MPDEIQQLSLEQAATYLLEECRMVLPGIQALFGFQLIAVFNNGFNTALSPNEQIVHLVAILCVVLSVALVMAPAALHRRREPESISRRFIQISSRLLMSSMAPLAVGTTLDVYLVARIILHSYAGAAVIAGLTLVAFTTLWFLFPGVVGPDRARR